MSAEFEEDGGEDEIFFTIPSLEDLQQSIDDESCPIAKRMRSCFLLKQLGGEEAVLTLSRGLYSPSTLLGHECAYVMGQMQDVCAVPLLTGCLLDPSAHPIVRHECAEALANIDADESLPVLESLVNDQCREVADTAIIAVEKMRSVRTAVTSIEERGDAPLSKYASVDPAPPLPSTDIPYLLSILSNPSLSLYQRYRAMFSLRNIGSPEAIQALSASLSFSSSAVFRHEIAYVMGQIASPHAMECLRGLLADGKEHAMVRHEAAEAIGSIAEEESESVLGPYVKDEGEDVIVKESCYVALDLAEYWNNDEISTAVPIKVEEQREGEKGKKRTDTADIEVKPFVRSVKSN